jgi:hypothetical protein
MPTIYPPKLREIYANTFFRPSSIVTNVPTSNYVLASDGNGTTRWVVQSGGGGGPTTIPADLEVSTLFAFDTISSASTFVEYISAGIGVFNYLSTQDLRVSSINGLPPGSGGGLVAVPPNLNLSTLNVVDTISSVSTFVKYISAGIGVFNFISVTDIYISSINNQAILTPVDLISTVDGLGTANYISSTQLFSTVEGLGTANYISSTQLTSTVTGLGTANYISSTQLTSTVGGLGTANYISSTQLTSTVGGLGTANYISSTQLTSTVEGLGTATYISSTQLTSTVAGLGTAGYISSQQLASTVLGLPSLRFGSGQTDNTGIISLTFTPVFTTTPSVYATAQGFSVLAVTNIATSNATVLSFNPTNGLAQGGVPFQWLAIGFM